MQRCLKFRASDFFFRIFFLLFWLIFLRIRWLAISMRKLLPEGTEIIEDYFHPDLKWGKKHTLFFTRVFFGHKNVFYAFFPGHSKPMQVDVWIPKLNLALEYQGLLIFKKLCSPRHFFPSNFPRKGVQHYFDMNSAFGPSGTLALYEERDTLKKRTASEIGIKFLEIPYWYGY